MSEKQSGGSKNDGLDGSLQESLRVGLATGGIGFLLGGTAGILKNATPFLFGLASSIQCASLGSSFWLSRAELLRAWNHPVETGTVTQASGIAGAVSGGATALIFRGPRNVLPGIICMAALGAGGQAAYDRYQRRRLAAEGRPSLWQSLTSAKWSPMQSISDEDYAKMLKEQLLKNQVEISILDDRIAALKLETASVPEASSKQNGT